jgi:hypothetical protein
LSLDRLPDLRMSEGALELRGELLGGRRRLRVLLRELLDREDVLAVPERVGFGQALSHRRAT